MSLSVPRIALKKSTPAISFVRNSGKLRFSNFRHDYLHGLGKGPADNAKFFKKLSIFCIIPIGISLYLGIKDEEHVHHELPKWKEAHKEYPYRYLRKREFPWGRCILAILLGCPKGDGNHTLFHSPNQFVPGVGFEGGDDHH